MGEAKRKQYNREQFLQEHPWCTYCGGLATTTDHCPPRCFFRRREWPETYEFPACGPCNQEARRDEQVLAVLARHHFRLEEGGLDQDEWLKLVEGVKNNQPAYAAEWLGLSRVQQKWRLREAFDLAPGEMGKLAAANIGPLTRGAINRFSVKMGKALFYRHNHQLFDGTILLRHVNGLASGTDELLATMLRLAPLKPEIGRGGRSLTDQFTYRYDHSAEHGAIHAVVAFNPQLVLSITALGHELFEALVEARAEAGESLPTEMVHRCPLKHRPTLI